MLDPGTLIAGRYEIQHHLGSGGSGSVYAASDRTTKRRVAVKIFEDRRDWSRVETARFKIETSVAGLVNSEHIVQVFDAGVDPQVHYAFLVMEFLDGWNLQELIVQSGRLQASVAVEYLRQTASGLDKAHAWNDEAGRPSPILHLDLKPANVFLIHREDGAPLVKILDWGLAKIQSTSVTVSGEIRGSPFYIAPERISQKPPTPATDIWAIGLMAFYLLTGQCYWKSAQSTHATWPAIVKEVSDGPTIRPSARIRELELDIELPPAFDDWFMRCVNVKPEERFQHAGEAVQALAAALKPLVGELSWATGDSQATGSASRSRRVARSFRVKATKGIVFSLVALLLLLAGIFVWWDYTRVKVAWYAHLTQRWGVPEGTVRLDENTVRHRTTSFRVESSGGRVRRILRVNSAGQLRDDEETFGSSIQEVVYS